MGTPSKSDPRIFVSHSRKDDEFTQRLVSDLHAAGAEVWVDVAGISHGNFMQVIDEALQRCDWMVLVLTPNAIASQYVKDEVYTALHRVNQGYMRAVIPVLAASCAPGSIPPQWDVLQRYDAMPGYAAALARLLSTLGLPPLSRSASPSTTQSSIIDVSAIPQPAANPFGPIMQQLADGSVTRIVNRAGPAVVNISVMKPISRLADAPSDAPPRMAEGGASGMIFAPDGYILTASHVVDGAKQITVTLADGRILPGAMVGEDPDTDVAVLRVKSPSGHQLPTVQLGDSDRLQVGELVVAIGNALGLPNTVTPGIISGLHRALPGYGGHLIDDVIQTTIALTPGASGGPLLTAAGEAVGMNLAFMKDAQGISFATPINTIKWVAAALMRDGEVRRAMLGFAGQSGTLPQSLRQTLKIENELAVEIIQLVPGGPGERAGLRPRDVIYKVDGKPVGTADDIRRLLERLPDGTRVKLAIIRPTGKSPQKAEVTVAVKTAPSGHR